MQPLQSAVIDAIRAAPEPISLAELAQHLHSTRGSIKVRICHLRAECSQIETVTFGHNDHRYQWTG
jgi:biotin operon repressor